MEISYFYKKKEIAINTQYLASFLAEGKLSLRQTKQFLQAALRLNQPSYTGDRKFQSLKKTFCHYGEFESLISQVYGRGGLLFPDPVLRFQSELCFC